MPTNPRFHVFLSHNSRDKDEVRKLCAALAGRGVTLWFDEEQIPPGSRIAECIDTGLKASRAVAVLLGRSGWGAWHEEEMWAAIPPFVVERRGPVIPILLPGAPDEKTLDLPYFLKGLRWIDLRGGISEEALEDFIWAVGAPRSPPEREEPAEVSSPQLHNLRALSLGALFCGRDEDLAHLAGELTPDRPRVLFGLGGVGKTRLALEHAWRQGARHAGVFLVAAASKAGLSTQLAALADPETLDLAPAVALESEKLAAVLGWLREHPGWLLVLDRADDDEAAAAVQELLPRLTAGCVIVTSRLSRLWPPPLVQSEVHPLETGAARDFLLARTADRRLPAADDPGGAERIADLLGGLPLALEQAGAYIEHHEMSFAEYLAGWESEPEREAFLRWGADEPEAMLQVPRALAFTFLQAFQRLEPATAALLRLAAFLAPDPLPEEVVRRGAPELAEALELLGQETAAKAAPPAAPLALQLRDAISELSSYSLLRRRRDRSGFAVHRMVQEATRLAIPGERRAAWVALSLRLIGRAAVGAPDDPDDWPAWNRLYPHALAVTGHAERHGLGASCWRLKNQVGALLLTQGLPEEAEPLLVRALALARQNLPPRHPDLARVMSNLAEVLKLAGKAAEAEALLRAAVAASEGAEGAPPKDLSTQLSNLAVLVGLRGDAREAEELLRRALDLDEQRIPPSPAAVSRDLSNLATFLKDRGELAEAEALLRRALALDRERDANHPDVAFDLANLASVLLGQGRAAEAEPLLAEAVEHFRQSYGDDHPTTRAARESWERFQEKKAAPPTPAS